MNDKTSITTSQDGDAKFNADRLSEIKDEIHEAQLTSKAAHAMLELFLEDAHPGLSDELINAAKACVSQVMAAMDRAHSAAWAAEQGPVRGFD